MIYLRTIFSAANEIKFIKLNLKESWNYVDKFIVCEYNYTHTGEKRDLIFNNYKDQFSDEEWKKILYLGIDISDEIVYAKDNRELSLKNNHIFLGNFVKHVDLDDEDIVFALDADEIISSQYYSDIITRLRRSKWPWQTKAIALPIRVFFYKINYLWEGKKYIAPIACKAKVYKNKYPGHWRYKGKLYPTYVGCHFSWCLSVDEMMKKLKVYAHQSEYGHFVKKEILEDAIKNKKYPFDPAVDFKIKVLDIYTDREYYPKSIYGMLDEFKDLIA